MNKKIYTPIIIILIVCATFLTGCVEDSSKNDKQPSDETVEDIAKGLIHHFVNGTVDEAYNQLFTDEVKAQTTPEQLELFWTQITSQYGDFININRTRTAEEQGYTVVYVTCNYANLGFLDTRVVFNADKLIAGLQFVPTDVSDQYQPPSYANTQNFTEHEVTIGTGTAWSLPGTLTLPKGNGTFPCVILVHGSGPNDRDETIGPNKPFKDLAWGLATKGVAVLRYEKRTKHYADTIVNMLNTLTVKEETVDDVLAAIELLTTYDTIDPSRIYVLGHSLGGMLAPRIANRTTEIAGLIMLAAPTRPLEDLMLNQTIYLAQLDGNISDFEQKQINLLRENVTKIKTLNISDNEIVVGAGRAYWADLAEYYPVETAKKLTIPMLLMQGERDYQVLYDEDFIKWQNQLSVYPDVTFHAYESLNHLFISGSGPPTNQEYNTPGNLAEEVINDIVTWITSR